jgi:hypothetical protein
LHWAFGFTSFHGTVTGLQQQKSLFPAKHEKEAQYKRIVRFSAGGRTLYAGTAPAVLKTA